MKCKEIKFLLTDYINGSVADDEKKEITEHLAKCADCESDKEEILQLLAFIQNEKSWTPDEAYWNNILPRIHSRLEKKSSSKPLDGLIRLAAPVAASLILIVFSLNYFLPSSDNKLFSAKFAISQLTQDELQSYIRQESILGLQEQYDSTNDMISSSDDKTVLKELLKQDDGALVYLESDQTIDLSNLTDQDAENLIPIIEKNIGPSRY